MYAMTGKLVACAGKRPELVEILLRAAGQVGRLPGCHLYAVTEDLAEEAAVWVLEIWSDRAAHDASLADTQVRALIAAAMPLLDAPPEGVGLRVAGGHGLPG